LGSLYMHGVVRAQHAPYMCMCRCMHMPYICMHTRIEGTCWARSGRGDLVGRAHDLVRVRVGVGVRVGVRVRDRVRVRVRVAVRVRVRARAAIWLDELKTEPKPSGSPSRFHARPC
jgi:hypothetical protein